MRHRLQTGHDGVTALCYDICRQRTTSFMTLLAITPEKDTHAQNRERVPLTDRSEARSCRYAICKSPYTLHSLLPFTLFIDSCSIPSACVTETVGVW